VSAEALSQNEASAVSLVARVPARAAPPATAWVGAGVTSLALPRSRPAWNEARVPPRAPVFCERAPGEAVGDSQS